MTGLFGPTLWLSARLSFSRKYLLIGVVVLLALLMLGLPLLQRTGAERALAQKQREGLQQFLSQIRVLETLVHARGDVPGTSGTLNRDTLAQVLGTIQRQTQRSADALLLQRVQRTLSELLTESLPEEHRFAQLTVLIQAWLDVIRESASSHRLNIDAELYASFDALTTTLPAVMDTLGRQRDAMSLHNAEMTQLALGAQVVLTNATRHLRAGVMPLAQDQPAIVPVLDQLLKGISQQQEAVDAAPDQPLQIAHLRDIAQANLDAADALLVAASGQADTVLLHRIQRLRQVQWGIVGLFVSMLLGLTYLFAGIYLSTMRSLRSLSQGTAAFCQGKLDTRVHIETRDELVEVAHNFNTVAGEVERLLGVIHSQNESRERELQAQVALRTAELAQKNEQLRAVNERVLTEVDMARTMQLAILPQHFPCDANWSLHACTHPAREMGGDFYDWVALKDGRFGVLVADVSGKGVAAAFFMAVSRTVLLDLAATGQSPSEVLRRANDVLCQRNPLYLFVTVCYAIFDPTSGRLVYASAGHPPPFLRRQNGSVIPLTLCYDIALGITPGATYQNCDAAIDAQEMLLMYTDGVTESMSPTGQAYEESRLIQWFEGLSSPTLSAQMVVNELVYEIHQFVAGAEPFDDLTCLVLCRKQGDTHVEKQDTPITVPVTPDKRLLLNWDMSSKLEEIPRLAQEVERVLADWPSLTFQANLCLDELLTNTIQYGLKGATDRRIHIRISISKEWLEIIIKDDAPPFDPFSQAPSPDMTASVQNRPVGGLGIHIVKSMMDIVRAYYDGSGNLIVLLKTLPDTKDKKP